MSKWTELAQCIKDRDNTNIRDINSLYAIPPLEALVDLANNRGLDALVAIAQILHGIDSLENRLSELEHGRSSIRPIKQ